MRTENSMKTVPITILKKKVFHTNFNIATVILPGLWWERGVGVGVAWAWRGRGVGVAWAWRGVAWAPLAAALQGRHARGEEAC